MLRVIIKSPTKIIWEGEAEAVSSENTVGPFDILEGHANFVTLVEKKDIIVQTKNNEEIRFSFSRAAIFTQNDLVSVYTHLEHKR